MKKKTEQPLTHLYLFLPRREHGERATVAPGLIGEVQSWTKNEGTVVAVRIEDFERWLPRAKRAISAWKKKHPGELP